MFIPFVYNDNDRVRNLWLPLLSFAVRCCSLFVVVLGEERDRAKERQRHSVRVAIFPIEPSKHFVCWVVCRIYIVVSRQCARRVSTKNKIKGGNDIESSRAVVREAKASEVTSLERPIDP